MHTGQNESGRRVLAQLVLLLAGVGCLLIGAVRGELGVVLEKAAKLCLECVGIG